MYGELGCNKTKANKRKHNVKASLPVFDVVNHRIWCKNFTNQ